MEDGPIRRLVGSALLPVGALSSAIVEVAAGRISDVQQAPRADLVRALRRDRTVVRLARDEILSPAFIDIHCHGAGGADAFGGPASLATMAGSLSAHGVGAFVAALMTAPLVRLLEAARQADAWIRAGGDPGPSRPGAQLLGVHLEGPALSPVRSAGHDQAALVAPSVLARSLSEDPPAWRAVRVVTLAPELDGGLDLVSRLAAAGIVASIGHTDASAEVASAAFAAGARSTTHLFNGMPPLHHREPGPVGASLADARFIELISDGIHVAGSLLAPVARAIGAERLILVSDAAPIAASRRRRVATDGSTTCLRRGRAVHPDGTLAGSRLLLDGMVRSAVRHGVPLSVALRAATENPARLLGLSDRGVIAAGAVADLVVVSTEGRLRGVPALLL